MCNSGIFDTAMVFAQLKQCRMQIKDIRQLVQPVRHISHPARTAEKYLSHLTQAVREQHMVASEAMGTDEVTDFFGMKCRTAMWNARAGTYRLWLAMEANIIDKITEFSQLSENEQELRCATGDWPDCMIFAMSRLHNEKASQFERDVDVEYVLPDTEQVCTAFDKQKEDIGLGRLRMEWPDPAHPKCKVTFTLPRGITVPNDMCDNSNGNEAIEWWVTCPFINFRLLNHNEGRRYTSFPKTSPFFPETGQAW